MRSIGQMIQHAVQLHTAGRLAEAERGYQQVLALAPNEPAALHLYGALLHQKGDHPAAANLVKRAVMLQPANADAHTNLAAICQKLGDAPGALAAGKKATELQPHSPEAWNNFGLALKLAGDKESAVMALHRAWQLKPGYSEAASNLGNLLADLGRYPEAIAVFDSALRQRVTPNLLYNFGLTLRKTDRRADAINLFQQACRTEPTNAEFLATLGDTYLESAAYTPAIEVYQRALQLSPNLTRLYMNLGCAYRETNRLEEAVAMHRRAVEAQPDLADAHFNFALTALSAGDYLTGWKEHEWRWQSTGFTSAPRTFPQPIWDGQQSLEGKTVLVHAEQGYGDTLQFVRFIPQLAALGAKVVLECQPPMVRLLRSIPAVTQVVARDDPLPDFDLRIAMMSLPFALKTTLHTVPQGVPYLSSDANDAARWKQKLNALSETAPFKVGLAWAGNPSRQLDRLRSITLNTFKSLAACRNVQFVSLQKLVGAEQAKQPPVGMALMDFTDEFEDFADTAALVSQLDLIISIDSAVAHLAGALAKPVWVLLPFSAGWRWMVNRPDSPWYPTARLFRQSQPNDWAGVMGAVQLALSNLSNASRPTAAS